MSVSIGAAPATSASPVVTNTAVGGTLAGLLTLVAALVASVTKNGFSLGDALAALSGAGISVSGLVTLALHHSAALRHDTAIAVAAVPDLTTLRSDVDALKPVASDVKSLVEEVAPGLDSRIDVEAAKATAKIQAVASEVEAKLGITSEQATVISHKVITDVLTALGVTLPPGLTPTVAPVTAGRAGADTAPPADSVPAPGA